MERKFDSVKAGTLRVDRKKTVKDAGRSDWFDFLFVRDNRDIPVVANKVFSDILQNPEVSITNTSGLIAFGGLMILHECFSTITIIPAKSAHILYMDCSFHWPLLDTGQRMRAPWRSRSRCSTFGSLSQGDCQTIAERFRHRCWSTLGRATGDDCDT